jgi:hypothetical protein
VQVTSFVDDAVAAPAQAIDDDVFIDVKAGRARLELPGLEARQQALANEVLDQLLFIVADDGARGGKLVRVEQARFE